MRPRPQEYLLTTRVGNVSRKVVWQSDQPMDLDMPHGWTVAKVGEKIRIRDKFNPNMKAMFFLDDADIAGGVNQIIHLPSAKKSNGRRPLVVKITKLNPPRPVYVNNPTNNALRTTAPRQLCAFYGQRYFLIRYRPVGIVHSISFGNLNIFSYKKSAKGYTISAQQQSLKINVGGKKTLLPSGRTCELSEVDFFRCTILYGIHWWRVRMVPTPDGQPPLETDETEMEIRESVRLQYSTVGFLAMFSLFLFSVYVLGRLNPPKPMPPRTNVTFKQAKIFPPFVKPPATMPPPPKIAEVKPPPPPKPVRPPSPPPKAVVKAPPVPKKSKQVAKKVVKRPKSEPVKQVAKTPPPPIPKPSPPTPPPPEPKVVKELGPTPEQLRAMQRALVQQAEQAQALKALNFLSTSKNRPTVEATDYDQKKGKFSDTPMVGGLAGKSNVLDKIAKGAPGDGNIKTNSGRNVASDIDFGKSKGLNDVQGKVSLGELYSKNGNPGGALGSGKGLELSGPGQLSESQIEKALAKFLSRFQYCYEKSLLSDSSLGGNLVVQWSISTAGKASESRVIKSQLNNNDLHNCVLKVLADVKFPSPKGGSVTVKKTFSFSSSSM